MKHRLANLSDVAWLADWNHQLIRDEGARNTMTVPELEMRMRQWLSGECQAMVFEKDDHVAAYALYRQGSNSVHLRHFYAGTRSDAAEAGFDDEFVYRELALPFERRFGNEPTDATGSARGLRRMGC